MERYIIPEIGILSLSAGDVISNSTIDTRGQGENETGLDIIDA